MGAMIFAPLFGKLIDHIGARTTLLISLWGYFILGAGGAFLYGPWQIAIDRIILGGFAAGLMAAGTAVISQWYQGFARLNMIAKQGMAIELGGVVFLFIGGLLSELSWQAPFLLYVMGLLCAILTVFFVPRRKASDIPEENSVTVSSNASSMGSIMLFTVLAMGLFFSFIISLPGFLASLDYSEAQTGYVLSFISLVAVFSAMTMPKVVARFSVKYTLGIAFLTYAIGHVLFAFSSVTMSIILASVFAGIGFGLSIPLLNHSTVEMSNSRNLGRNLSLFAMAVFTGQFVTSVLEFIPLNHGKIFLVCAGLAVLCSIAVVNRKTSA
ncbi:MFS transporter [Marinomonas ushuaiensis]|uniref:MFS transporter n=1 Tax=Marinomonas ushuaiensis TaxID=263818 RepID=UPI00316AC1B1